MKEKLNNWKYLVLFIVLGIVVAAMLFTFLIDKREAEISVDAESITLKIGETWDIPLKIEEGQTAPVVSFAAENASVASVSEKGRVTGLREGETWIILTTKGGQRAEVNVTVAAEEKSSKVIYLTYEGGPSMEVTPPLLELLAKYDARVSFFPYGQEAEGCPDPVQQAAEQGHTVGVFVYSADYAGIYESVPHYQENFRKTEDIIREITGRQPEYMRFPGGSINDSMTAENRKVIMDDLHEKGYVCVDWNCYIDDLSDEENSARSMWKTGIRTIEQAIDMGQIPVVRMYDRTDEGQTLKVTRKIIKHFRKDGYEFRALSDYEGTDILAGE